MLLTIIGCFCTKLSTQLMVRAWGTWKRQKIIQTGDCSPMRDWHPMSTSAIFFNECAVVTLWFIYSKREQKDGCLHQTINTWTQFCSKSNQLSSSGNAKSTLGGRQVHCELSRSSEAEIFNTGLYATLVFLAAFLPDWNKCVVFFF